MIENNPMFDKDIAKNHSIKMSRKYLIIKPNGSRCIIENITKYCKKEKLHTGYMCQLANGNIGYYKGYGCIKLN